VPQYRCVPAPPKLPLLVCQPAPWLLTWIGDALLSGLPADSTTGLQFDLAAQACVKCPAGQWRNYADNSTESCVDW